SDSIEEVQLLKLGIVKKSYIFLALYFVVLIFGGIAAYIFIMLFFKEKYEESIRFLPFFLGFNFFNSCYIIFSMIIYYSKTTKYLGVITIATSFVHVVLIVSLTNVFGAVGTAASSLIVSILTMFAIYFYSNRVYPMPWFEFSTIFQKGITNNNSNK